MTRGASQLGRGSVVAGSGSGLAVVRLCPTNKLGCFPLPLKQASSAGPRVGCNSVSGGRDPRLVLSDGDFDSAAALSFPTGPDTSATQGRTNGIVGHCTLSAIEPFSQIFPHANCGKKVSNQPLRPCRGRFWKTLGTIAVRDFWEIGYKSKNYSLPLPGAAGGRVGRIWKGSECPAEVSNIYR